MTDQLTTRAEWDTFTPFNQGFILYMEEEWPGSELKGLVNPYPKDSDKYRQFCDGQMRAYISVLDTAE